MLQYWWQLLIFSLCCYFFANINYAVIISKAFKHNDIRKLGSGNAGTTNMLRNFGFATGILTLLLDIVKGVICTLTGLLVFKYFYNVNVGLFAAYLGGASCIVGHIFPVFLKFKGGKGFASSIGVMLVINPWLTLGVLAAGLLLLLSTDKMSIYALTYFGVIILYHVVYYGILGNILLIVCGCVIGLVPIIAHWSNIIRLLKDKENQTGLRKYIFKNLE